MQDSQRAVHSDSVVEEHRPARLTWWTEARMQSLATGLGAAAVLVVARLLSPDLSGYGTHQHFFLLPCLLRWAIGLPCPFCGMTTAFALMADGHVAAAFGAHVLGPPAYLVTWGILLAGIAGLVRNRMPLPRWLLSPSGGRVIIVILLVGWAINLVRWLD